MASENDAPIDVKLGWAVPRQLFLPNCRSATAGQSHRSLQGGKDLAGNVTFEATHDFELAHSLSGSAAHVLFGSMVATKPDYDDAV